MIVVFSPPTWSFTCSSPSAFSAALWCCLLKALTVDRNNNNDNGDVVGWLVGCFSKQQLLVDFCLLFLFGHNSRLSLLPYYYYCNWKLRSSIRCFLLLHHSFIHFTSCFPKVALPPQLLSSLSDRISANLLVTEFSASVTNLNQDQLIIKRRGNDKCWKESEKTKMENYEDREEWRKVKAEKNWSLFNICICLLYRHTKVWSGVFPFTAAPLSLPPVISIIWGSLVVNGILIILYLLLFSHLLISFFYLLVMR